MATVPPDGLQNDAPESADVLAERLAALAERFDPVPEAVVEAARAAFNAKPSVDLERADEAGDEVSA